MTQYIQFKTTDDHVILVEVEETEGSPTTGTVKAGLGETAQEAVIKAQSTFEDALDTVRQSADAVIGKLRTLHDKPDEIEVAFGLKATGEAGNFAIAKVGLEANYTVKLTWKGEQRESK